MTDYNWSLYRPRALPARRTAYSAQHPGRLVNVSYLNGGHLHTQRRVPFCKTVRRCSHEIDPEISPSSKYTDTPDPRTHAKGADAKTTRRGRQDKLARWNESGPCKLTNQPGTLIAA